MSKTIDSERITDFLPDWASRYVRETAFELQVPENAVALLTLGAVAAAVNGGANTMPLATWREPLNLYVLALLKSGEGKSPVFTRLLDPVRDAIDDLIDSPVGDLAQQQARTRLNRRLLKKFETQMFQAVAAKTVTLDEAVQAIAAEEARLRLDRGSEYLPIELLTDATPAAVLDALAKNDGRIVVASPEAESLLIFRGASKEGVLKGFDGELLRQSRRTTGELLIERPVINMVLSMQPTILGQLGPDMVERGLMPRFLISYPESQVGSRNSRPTIVSQEASEAYEVAIREIVERFARPGVIEDIRWDKTAVRRIGPWRDEIEPQLAPGGLLAPIGAWASKVRGAHFIRVAGLLAVMAGASVVSPDNADKAAAILRILTTDAVRAFGEMGASFTDDDLVHLMNLAKRFDGPFAKRDVMRRSNRFMAARERCDNALAVAVREGLLDQVGTENRPKWVVAS